MFTDLRFALRQIAKSPGYAAVVVLTLAFGIAVNSNIFAMVDVFLLRKMPVPEADKLVLVLQKSEAWNMPHGPSFPDFKDYRDRMHTLRDVIAYFPNPAHLSAEGKSPERAWVEVVTPNGFSALGVRAEPGLGRVLVPSDGEAKGAPPVTVLSYDCWQQRFGGDPAIVGRSVVLNGRPFTVVGVARKGFHGFTYSLALSAWVPSGALGSLREGAEGMLEWRGAAGAWRMLARLQPGVSLAEARADAAVVTSQLVQEYPEDHHGVRSVVIPERLARPDPTFADFLPLFAALFVGLVGLVLFIACANVANLMLARAVTRDRELTMRAALGASRWRIMRQLLVESLVLAAIAGVVGWLLGQASGVLLQRFQTQGDIPVNTDFGPQWPFYVFTAVISLIAGLASALPSAWRASRINLNEQLQQGSGSRVSRGHHRLRNLFVVSQVTFSLVVLVCAGLFLRSLHRIRSVELGFRPDHLLMVSYDLGLQGYAQDRGTNFNRQLLDRVRALPGVVDASLTSHVPFSYGMLGRDIRPENPPPTMKDGSTNVSTAIVEPGFPEMLGVPLRHGRALAATDSASTPRVAVVNQALADLCWPAQDAVGKRFQPWKDGPWIEVVGVTENAKYVMLAESGRPFYYESLAQDYLAPLTLMVRTTAEPAAHAHAVRAVVHDLDPHLPVFDVRTMEDLMNTSVFALLPFRMGVTLATVQGVIGLLLAVMGLYAVVSFGVARRTREIGIRMALGAEPRRVVGAVLAESVRLTFIGVVIGLLIATAAGFGMSRALYGLGAIDPVVLGGVTLLLVGVAGFACWWPARRATRVDPVVALRAE